MSTEGARITWESGGEGRVVRADGVLVTVRSTRAFPPGAPPNGTLHTEPSHAFTLKVAGSRREGDAFVVRGRLVNATVAVLAAFGGASPAR